MPHEVFTANVTFSNNVLVAMTPASGDPASFTVRKSEEPRLLGFWANYQVGAGVLRIRSTLFHDNTQGLREVVGAAKLPMPLHIQGVFQGLQSQDGLIVEAQDADAAGNIEVAGLWIYYKNLPGSQGRLIDENALRDHAVQLFDQEVDLAPGAGGGYTGSKAVNGTFDLMKAETDYGFVGAIFGGVAAGASPDAAHVGLKGADTGQLRVPIPAIQTSAGYQDETARWFAYVGREAALPLIPIINAANKSATFLDSASSQAAIAFNVVLKGLQLTPEADKAGAVAPAPASKAAPGTGGISTPRVLGGVNIPVGSRLAIR